MHVATRIFDRLFADGELPDRVCFRFRQAVRLAMLFHDLGHAPLSHTTEMLMPSVGELGLGKFSGDDVTRRASHEDYTLKIVLDSALGDALRAQFEDDGIVPEDVAELIVGTTWQGASVRFRHGGPAADRQLRV
jgi:HD superfamily phosphohydrolase